MKNKIIFLFSLVCLLYTSAALSQETPLRAFGVTERQTFFDTNGVPYKLPVLKSGLTNVKLKKSNGADSVSGVEIGTTGVYQFDFTGKSNIGSHYWQMYIDYTLKSEFGKIQMGTALMTDGTLPMQGQLNMNNFRIYNLGDPASGIDAVNLSYLQANYLTTTAADTHYVTRGSTQTIYGLKNFSNNVIVSGSLFQTTTAATVDIRLSTDGGNYPKVSIGGTDYYPPPTDISIATKKYVDDEVASITVVPFQESVNKVRLMPGGSQHTGQVYLSYSNAANYFSSPSVTRQCQVEIPGTGLTTQYIQISHNNLRNYVHTIAAGKQINIILGVALDAASVTKTMTFENATIWLGANSISSARTYNGVSFVNCVIYAYRDVTFTNATLTNCTIYQANGFGVTVDGSTVIEGCKLMQPLTIGGSFSGMVIGTNDQQNMGYTLPTDPSTGSSEE